MQQEDVSDQQKLAIVVCYWVTSEPTRLLQNASHFWLQGSAMSFKRVQRTPPLR